MLILDRLRAETADLHAAVERESGLVDDRVRMDDYVRILGRIHAFHAAVEPTIARAVRDEPFMAPRRRIADLDRDLAALGGRPGPARPAWTPVAPGDIPAGLGAAYVLDGSRLGARTVAQHLFRRLGLRADTGASYFTGDPRAAVDLWRETVDRLSQLPSEAVDAAVRGASATFEAFRTIVCHPSEGARTCSRIPAPT